MADRKLYGKIRNAVVKGINEAFDINDMDNDMSAETS